MKAIRIFQHRTEAIGGTLLPILRLYADSAIGRDVMPLFIPDFPGGWYVRVCVAVRVNRLGKGISTRFAMRYADAISAVALMLPMSGSKEWDESGALTLLDSAVTTGRWQECNLTDLTTVSLQAGDTRHTFSAAEFDIAIAISDVSRLATLRTGDILILDSTGIDLPLTPDTHIDAAINGETCLSLKIK